MSDIGYFFSVFLGFFIGVYVRNWIWETKERNQREEEERINARLRNQINAIQRDQELKRQIEKVRLEAERLEQKRIDNFLEDPETLVYPIIPDNFINPPKDGLLISYKGKIMTYKKDEGWVNLAVNNEKLIWDTLMSKIQNPYGVAGLMGNLFAESSLNPKCKTGGNADFKPVPTEYYISMIDTDYTDCETFSHDGVAFGLVQWTYWSRKENLYSFVKGKGASIADLKTQLDFMLEELPKYKTVWATLLNATSVKEASDIVMLRYEQPGNTSDKAKEKRASFSQGYFDKFALQEEPSPMKRYVVTIKPNVNLRVGNSKSYPLAGKAIIAGSKYEWVATSDNNWHAIVAKSGKQVMWIDGSFCRIEEE